MFFFEIDGITHGVVITRVGNRTFAELMDVTEKGNLAHTNIVGEVGLYYKDRYDAKVGRKLAFARLMDKLQKVLDLSKEERATVWSFFFDKFGK